ncbi:hypothetical protein ACN38_g11944 [Penicillium nordicum]|uniref:Uncharacterized protein n=1 Tax=Penicillium nordicum TaxID=229535 RepID=A0A0M8NQF4_9EURO|nr:hypothetical protein ACN38_g11944 [Penicillium nordicum]
MKDKEEDEEEEKKKKKVVKKKPRKTHVIYQLGIAPVTFSLHPRHLHLLSLPTDHPFLSKGKKKKRFIARVSDLAKRPLIDTSAPRVC